MVRPRARELRHRRGNVEEHLELVLQLVKELAAVQTTARELRAVAGPVELLGVKTIPVGIQPYLEVGLGYTLLSGG